DPRLLEDPLNGPLTGDQRELVAAPLAQVAAERDHRRSDGVERCKPAQVEPDAGHAFVAELLDLGFEDVRRAVIEIAREREGVRPRLDARQLRAPLAASR